MKKLRDLLIIVVLGGIVIRVFIWFGSSVRQASVNASPIVGQVEIACIEDEMLCHVGYDTFQSESDAQAYLNGPDHPRKTMEREQHRLKQETLEKTLQRHSSTSK